MTGPEPETGRIASPASGAYGIPQALPDAIPMDDEDWWLLLHGDYDEGA